MQGLSDRYEAEMVSRLQAAVAERLRSVVVYGPATHDDAYANGGEHLLIVVADLSARTLQQLARPVQWWLKKGEPWPRLFTTALLQSSVDVFPIEYLDLTTHRRVAYGDDPIAGIRIDRTHLRLQCERELREKLMRLREGFVESIERTGEKARLRELVVASYGSFAQIFRGCLYLFEAPIPRRDPDVVAALCTRLDLSPTAFAGAAQLVQGHKVPDAIATFTAYYDALVVLASRIDRLIVHREGRAP